MRIVVSVHAMQRSLERAQGADLARLWHVGREAQLSDHAAFGCAKDRGFEYRIAAHCGQSYLLVACNNVLITLYTRRGY